MYLKITGIVLIMMSASLMGYLFSKDYIERINRLEQIQKMLILLKGEISYSNNSVQEALENISEMIEGKVGEFVTKVQATKTLTLMKLLRNQHQVLQQFLQLQHL